MTLFPANPPRGFLANNALSIALWMIFLACLVGDATTGAAAYNSDLAASNLPKLSLLAYLGTGDFLDGLFSNWQAAILQLAVFLSLGAKLRQRGSPHSPRTAAEREAQGAPPRDVPRSGWLWANSLSLVFFGGFVLAMAAHGLFGLMKHNEEQALRHLPPERLISYLASTDFWRSVFQCWQAEAFALAAFVVLTVFLRQEGSPESKPVEAPRSSTGETDA